MEKKFKFRIVFIIFIAISFIILLTYNLTHDEIGANGMLNNIYSEVNFENMISDRVNIIIYIFFLATASVLYMIYESYRVIYSELADRMYRLDASRNDLQISYDSTPMLLIEIDLNLNIININKALSDNLNSKKSNIIGKKLDQILELSDESKEILEDGVEQTFKFAKYQKFEIEHKGKIYEAYVSPLSDDKDNVKKVLLMFNDVTSSRAIYRQVLQDNKMIAVGQLAAGIAHEIRNPLGIIRNYCYILKNSQEYDKSVIEKAIVAIEKSVDKSSKIIDNLLDFSMISNNVSEWIFLQPFLQSIVSLEDNLLETREVGVSIICPEDLQFITITESLEIIIINLIINAVDAMPKGGNIIIECLDSDGILKISVTDTGIGIPEKQIGNIFNPFFTTKEKRDGSGLGLYIVYNEVEKLGGKIEVESKVNEGTAFKLTFPIKRSEIYEGQKI